jgi:hypothetical protein
MNEDMNKPYTPIFDLETRVLLPTMVDFTIQELYRARGLPTQKIREVLVNNHGLKSDVYQTGQLKNYARKILWPLATIGTAYGFLEVEGFFESSFMLGVTTYCALKAKKYL